jgi:hypothetical protein
MNDLTIPGDPETPCVHCEHTRKAHCVGSVMAIDVTHCLGCWPDGRCDHRFKEDGAAERSRFANSD